MGDLARLACGWDTYGDDPVAECLCAHCQEFASGERSSRQVRPHTFLPETTQQTTQTTQDDPADEREWQLECQLRTDIAARGEAGWRSQYYTGNPRLLPFRQADACARWQTERDQWTRSGDPEALARMLRQVTYDNPPDAEKPRTAGTWPWPLLPLHIAWNVLVTAWDSPAVVGTAAGLVVISGMIALAAVLFGW